MDEGNNEELPTLAEIMSKTREEVKDKIKNLMNDPNASTEDIFNALRNGMGKAEQAKIDEMLKLGMSMEDIIKHFMDGGMGDAKADQQKMTSNSYITSWQNVTEYKDHKQPTMVNTFQPGGNGESNWLKEVLFS